MTRDYIAAEAIFLLQVMLARKKLDGFFRDEAERIVERHQAAIVRDREARDSIRQLSAERREQ